MGILEEKLIRLTAEGEMELIPFPEDKTARELCKLIAEDCDSIQEVRPRRLYKEFRCELHTDPEHPGVAVSMIVDEEYMMRDGLTEMNIVASYLYESDIHAHPILGTVLFVGRKLDENGDVDFCALNDEVALGLIIKLTETKETMRSFFRMKEREKQWIPVEQAMPPEHESVFAKFYGTDRWQPGMFRKRSEIVMLTVELEDGKRMVDCDPTLDGKWKDPFNRKRKVIAWMPMPGPYRG